MIQTFDTTALPATAWKNGGGTTREIVCQPPGADLDNFDWRVSIANITQPGPFSAFPGVDRIIMLLDGSGVRLCAKGLEHRVDTPGHPFTFAGDVALDCELLGGASTDFNVMTRRGTVQAQVEVIAETRHLAPAQQGLLFVQQGDWQLQAGAHEFHCASGQGLWWINRHVWQCAPLRHDSRLVYVSLQFNHKNSQKT